MSWIRHLAEEVGRRGAIVRVVVIRVDGSAPREVGAAMLVDADAISGTIGGGALEHEAIAHARAILARAGHGASWHREVRPFALGPSLGQCCGGAVLLLFEAFTRNHRAALERLCSTDHPQEAALLRPVLGGVPPHCAVLGATDAAYPPSVMRAVRRRAEAGLLPGPMLVAGGQGEPDWFVEPLADAGVPLVIYGAGHVGHALVNVLQNLPFRITWVDGRPGAFDGAPAGVSLRNDLVEPETLLASMPANAIHMVMTHSHPLDLAICHAVMKRGGYRFLGLIGSETKRARFLKRLRELGIAEDELTRLVCPIGLPCIRGKAPAIIAVAVAAQLLQLAGTSAKS